jgi:hypothetical protein
MSPLRRRTPLRRKKRLNARSQKRSAIVDERRELVVRELARREFCEAGAMIAGGCNGLARSTDIHEPLTRARGGSILDVENTMAVCRQCHIWIHDHPAQALELGFLKSRYAPDLSDEISDAQDV